MSHLINTVLNAPFITWCLPVVHLSVYYDLSNPGQLTHSILNRPASAFWVQPKQSPAFLEKTLPGGPSGSYVVFSQRGPDLGDLSHLFTRYVLV